MSGSIALALFGVGATGIMICIAIVLWCCLIVGARADRAYEAMLDRQRAQAGAFDFRAVSRITGAVIDEASGGAGAYRDFISHYADDANVAIECRANLQCGVAQ